MIDKQEFKKIRKEIEDFENKREQVIIKSREIIQISKQIIYALHRDDIKQAASSVKSINKKKQDLLKLTTISLDTNINQVAIQEYVEALTYYYFIKNKKIPSRKFLGVDTENYLMGLCDLTGELVRKAVNSVIHKNFKEAFLIKELVDGIYGEFLHFNLRNSELRKKSDSIKWNLKKLEDIIYDAKIKGKL